MEENMIRGAILSMQVDNNTKTKLFKYLSNLEELKTEHKSIKFNKKDFKRYITQYEGGIYLEREDEKISVVVGLQI